MQVAVRTLPDLNRRFLRHPAASLKPLNSGAVVDLPVGSGDKTGYRGARSLCRGSNVDAHDFAAFTASREISPVSWFSVLVSYGNYHDRFLIDSVYQRVRKASE